MAGTDLAHGVVPAPLRSVAAPDLCTAHVCSWPGRCDST